MYLFTLKIKTIVSFTSLIFLSFGCKSQNIQFFSQVDSFAKYSYQIVGVISSDTDSTKVKSLGTCFFIRRNNLLFMVTAKHTVSGFNTFTLQPIPDQYNSIGVSYYNADTKQQSLNLISIADIKQKQSNQYFYLEPDLFVAELDAHGIYKHIFSIEKFIYDSEYEENKGDFRLDSAFSFGFPEDTLAAFGNLPKLYRGKTIDLSILSTLKIPDNDIFYLLQPKSIKGRSGSPVFLKYLSKDNNIHYIFGGVLFGTNEIYNFTYVIRANKVMERIPSRFGD